MISRVCDEELVAAVERNLSWELKQRLSCEGARACRIYRCAVWFRSYERPLLRIRSTALSISRPLLAVALLGGGAFAACSDSVTHRVGNQAGDGGNGGTGNSGGLGGIGGSGGNIIGGSGQTGTGGGPALVTCEPPAKDCPTGQICVSTPSGGACSVEAARRRPVPERHLLLQGACRKDGVADGVCVAGETRPTNNACTTAVAVGAFARTCSASGSPPPGDPSRASTGPGDAARRRPAHRLRAGGRDHHRDIGQRQAPEPPAGDGTGARAHSHPERPDLRARGDASSRGPRVRDAATPAIADLDSDGKIGDRRAGSTFPNNTRSSRSPGSGDQYEVMWTSPDGRAERADASTGTASRSTISNNDGLPEVDRPRRRGVRRPDRHTSSPRRHRSSSKPIPSLGDVDQRRHRSSSSPTRCSLDGPAGPRSTRASRSTPVKAWRPSTLRRFRHVAPGRASSITPSKTASPRSCVGAVGAIRAREWSASTRWRDKVMRVDSRDASLRPGQATGSAAALPPSATSTATACPRSRRAGAYGVPRVRSRLQEAAMPGLRGNWHPLVAGLAGLQLGADRLDHLRLRGRRQGRGGLRRRVLPARLRRQDRRRPVLGVPQLVHLVGAAHRRRSRSTRTAPRSSSARNTNCVHRQCNDGARPARPAARPRRLRSTRSQGRALPRRTRTASRSNCDEGFCRCTTDAECGNTFKARSGGHHRRRGRSRLHDADRGHAGTGNVCRMQHANITDHARSADKTSPASRCTATSSTAGRRRARSGTSTPTASRTSTTTARSPRPPSGSRTSWIPSSTTSARTGRERPPPISPTSPARSTPPTLARPVKVNGEDKIRFTGQICNRGLRGVAATCRPASTSAPTPAVRRSARPRPQGRSPSATTASRSHVTSIPRRSRPASTDHHGRQRRRQGHAHHRRMQLHEQHQQRRHRQVRDRALTRSASGLASRGPKPFAVGESLPSGSSCPPPPIRRRPHRTPGGGGAWGAGRRAWA